MFGKTCRNGLFISKKYPNYAATPDSITENLIIEVKCPYSIREKDPNVNPPYYCQMIDGKPRLKKSHDYFAQIQRQLFVLGYKKAHFVVQTPIDISIEAIEYDEDWTKKLLQKTEKKLFQHFSTRNI